MGSISRTSCERMLSAIVISQDLVKMHGSHVRFSVMSDHHPSFTVSGIFPASRASSCMLAHCVEFAHLNLGVRFPVRFVLNNPFWFA